MILVVTARNHANTHEFGKQNEWYRVKRVHLISFIETNGSDRNKLFEWVLSNQILKI